MVHIDNMAHVLANGLVHWGSPKASQSYRPIGDGTLINARKTRSVPVEGHTSTINLSEYIPFYFGVRMPMLYVIQHGYNFVSQPIKADDIVYCVVRISTLKQMGVPFYFSDGHAFDYMTRFYSQEHIDQVSQLVDAHAVWSNYYFFLI